MTSLTTALQNLTSLKTVKQQEREQLSEAVSTSYKILLGHVTPAQPGQVAQFVPATLTPAFQSILDKSTNAGA
jgi:hypothetical protein